jgi:exosortase
VTRPHAAASAAIAVAAALGLVYWDILTGLAAQWSHDSDYSHGFVVLPLAAYFVYQRRARLRRARMRPTMWGLAVVCAGFVIFTAGVAAADVFLARISLLPVLAGCVLFLFGAAHLRVLVFPLLFLILMIPLPTIVFNDLTLPLQLIASQAGELALRMAGVPVVREGNVLELVGMRLEVAEACSGIRSLVALLTFALTFSQFSGPSKLRMLGLAIATIPVAVATNAARVAGTGLAAHVWGPIAARGVLHTASGTVAFCAAVLTLVALARVDRAFAATPMR